MHFISAGFSNHADMRTAIGSLRRIVIDVFTAISWIVSMGAVGSAWPMAE
jgi:hypothetical protein